MPYGLWLRVASHIYITELLSCTPPGLRWIDCSVVHMRPQAPEHFPAQIISLMNHVATDET